MLIDLNTSLSNYETNIKMRTGTFFGRCPECGKTCRFWRHGCYERNVVYWDGKIREKRQQVQRLFCQGCHHTHAILPYDVIPNRVYGLSFLIHLLRMISTYKKSVLFCQEHMEITSRSIYLILKSIQRCLHEDVEFSIYMSRSMSKTNCVPFQKQFVIRMLAEISVSNPKNTAFISGFS